MGGCVRPSPPRSVALQDTVQKQDSCNLQENKYVRSCNTRREMYAGRVAFRPLMSRVEYAPRPIKVIKNAPRALLELNNDGTDRQTDGQTDAKPLHYAYG